MYVLLSGVSHVSARAGRTFRSLSQRTSDSYARFLGSELDVLVTPNGASVTGSDETPQISVPPACGAGVAAAAAGALVEVTAGAAGAAGAAAGAGAHASSSQAAPSKPPVVVI